MQEWIKVGKRHMEVYDVVTAEELKLYDDVRLVMWKE